MAAAELVDELRDVLHPQSVSMRKVGETVVAVNLTLKYPLAMANLRQASLLLQEKHEALLHLDLKHHAVMEIKLEADADEYHSDQNEEPDDVEMSLQYFEHDRVLEKVVTTLFRYFNGIQVAADRRKTTDDVAALVVDGCRTVFVESFGRGMDGLSAFVNDVRFTGQRRMTLNVKLSTATRKRKRAD